MLELPGPHRELIFECLNPEYRAKIFPSILEFAQRRNLTNFEEYLRTSGYVGIVNSLDEKKGIELIKSDIAFYLQALRGKYGCKLEETDSSKDAEYSLECASILRDFDKRGILNSNCLNEIIDNLHKNDAGIIQRICLSNSSMIRGYAPQLIPTVMGMSGEEAEKLVDKIERLFGQKDLPDFIKIYKYYELVYSNKSNIKEYKEGEKISPVIKNAPGMKTVNRIIFSDLMKIAMDTNNKSMRRFLEKCSLGDAAHEKLLANNGDESKLSDSEIMDLHLYIKTLYVLYENSAQGRYDVEHGIKVELTGRIDEDISNLAQRYGNTKKPHLADKVLKTYIGPYEEIFGGITTIKQMQEYMDTKLKREDEYHRSICDKKMDLRAGDMVKGIKDYRRVFHSICSNGIRAGEFLGVDSHTDLTPFDTDFSMVMTNYGSAHDRIDTLLAAGYTDGIGRTMYIVLKNNPKKLEFTRSDFPGVKVEETTTAIRMGRIRNGDKNEIKRQVDTRTEGDYEDKKLEVFSIEAMGSDHCGVRTGFGMADVDYIIMDKWNPMVGFELAMNGTYVPVYDLEREEVIFTPEMYDSIREKMQGLSYYDGGDFVVDNSAYVDQAQDIVDEIFPTGDVENSTSQADSREKRNAILGEVTEVLAGEFDIGITDEVTGDLTPGFVEFIDTGSTGRGTNLPGDGDFDFTMKFDKEIMENPQRFEKIKEALRKKIGVRSDDPGVAIEEANGNFRYKKVKVDGLDQPVDIDITFMPKAEEIEYSTDMSVRDRLNGLKKTDPEGYKMVIANIILAKRMLKKEGLYKKFTSPGATEYGGFGGVGVENWILQNGGSFKKAMESFLETAEEHPVFEDFTMAYPIYDFGENHMGRGNLHDSFINGITEDGFRKMQTRFKAITAELTERPKQNLTFEEIGREAMGVIRENVAEEIRVGEMIESGVRSLEKDSQEQGI